MPLKMDTKKISWQGRLLSVQPRIRLLRSFDQRSHNYLGYALYLQGVTDGSEREFSVGIGKAAQEKHQLKWGDVVRGESYPVLDSRNETVEYYKTSRLEMIERSEISVVNPPPWTGIPPTLDIYRKRGHRRLDGRTFEAKCRQCIWGCRMPVEMIIDQWNPGRKHNGGRSC